MVQPVKQPVPRVRRWRCDSGYLLGRFVRQKQGRVRGERGDDEEAEGQNAVFHEVVCRTLSGFHL